MLKKISMIVALIGSALSSNAFAQQPLIIAPKINIGSSAQAHQPVAHRPHASVRRMSPERLAQLKALTEERSAELLGPAPVGLRRENYAYITGSRPSGNPCRPGYDMVNQVRDSVTKRVHFRCVRKGSGAMTAAPAGTPDDDI